MQTQMAATQAERDQAIAAAQHVGTNFSQLQGQLQALTEERDYLKAQYDVQPTPVEVDTGDVSTLEQQIVEKEQALQAARVAGDVETYERLASEHAKLSSAYARSLRLRQRR